MPKLACLCLSYSLARSPLRRPGSADILGYNLDIYIYNIYNIYIYNIYIIYIYISLVGGAITILKIYIRQWVSDDIPFFMVENEIHV